MQLSLAAMAMGCGVLPADCRLVGFHVGPPENALGGAVHSYGRHYLGHTVQAVAYHCYHPAGVCILFPHAARQPRMYTESFNEPFAISSEWLVDFEPSCVLNC